MITDIKLHNIATYVDPVEINDLKKINFIYGSNGTGKTTLSNFLYDSSSLGFSDCTKNKIKMTDLGLYLSKKSVNRLDVTRKTDISKTRLSELSNNSSTKLRVHELYLIALAVDVETAEVLNEVCKDLKLESEK